MSDEPETKKIKLEDCKSEPVESNLTVSDSNADVQESAQKLSSQSEKDVGIIEYISKSSPIFGILKQRFSDFIVHEVSKENNIIKLTITDLPNDKKLEYDDTVLEKSCREKLQSLNDGLSSENVEIPVDNLDKPRRKALHCSIKSLFPKLDSNTVDKEGSKFIQVCLKSKSTNIRNYWPSGRGKFVHFVMYKENRDTMEAINLLASKLRVNPSIFGYAGTKDRRAKTTQVVSVKQVLPKKLLMLNKYLRQIRIGNIEFKSTPLKLGDLSGNNFTVILREVNSCKENIDPALKSLQENGFINYFGMQRFGSTNVPTQHIGKALLKSDWKEAIDLILKPRNNDDPNFEKCRSVWLETKDPQKAFEELPKFKRHSIEGQLLTGVLKHKQNDLVGALSCIPRNIRLMYVHSYQSFVWNTTVSSRIKESGLEPIVGDLVFQDLPNDMHTGPSIQNKSSREVKTLTEEDISKNVYAIEDVVLPLPGYDVKYPENGLRNVFKNLLDYDGLDIENFRTKVKDYSLPGSYRKIIVKPTNTTWSLHEYNDPTESLELSDLDELEGIKLASEVQDGKFKALKLCFTLPSSSYATMALRDILKMDTSSNFQKSLNSSST